MKNYVWSMILTIPIAAFGILMMSARNAITSDDINRSSESTATKLSSNISAEIGKSDGNFTPHFTVVTADGNNCSLNSLNAKGPLVIAFVQDGCPCSERVQPYLNALNEAYGSRVQFAAIFDADANAARRWAEANGVRFPMLLDPNLDLVRHYDVKGATHIVLVGPDGRISRAWPAFSAGTFRDLGHRLAKATGLHEQSLDLSQLPEIPENGCPY